MRAEGAVLQTDNGERSGTITSEEIQDLTVLNRDFTTFAELQPGVVITVGQQVQTFGGGNTFNVLGGRTTDNTIMVDGMPTANNNQSGMNTTISLDNTQTVEVKVAKFLRRIRPEQWIHRDGGQQERRQPDAWRGLLLLPQRRLQRQQLLQQPLGSLAARQPRLLSRRQSGRTLQIPHFNPTRNKLFYFISAEKISELRPQNQVNVTVPTVLERQGDFSQSGTNAKPIAAGGAPVSIKDPTTGAVPRQHCSRQPHPAVDAELPQPAASAQLHFSGGPGGIQGRIQLHLPRKHRRAQWLYSARLDYNQSTNTSMYARFNYWYEDQQGDNVSADNTTWPWLPEHYTTITLTGILAHPYLQPDFGFPGQHVFFPVQRSRPAPEPAGTPGPQPAAGGLHHSAALSVRQSLQPGARGYVWRERFRQPRL